MTRSFRAIVWNLSGFAIAWLALHCTLSLAIAQEQSPAEAQGIFSDAANFQNAQQFNLAELEWEKFLSKFPKDPLAPKARYYLGVCQVQQTKFENALGNFQETLKQAPKFEQLEELLLRIGWCHYSLAQSGKAEQYADAAKGFGELAKQFPMGTLVDQALYFQGESLYALDKKEEAVAPYQTLVDKHPKSTLRQNAVYALGVAQEELGKYEEAGKAYDIYIAEFKDNPLITEVTMRKAETLLQAQKYQDAEKMFAGVVGTQGFENADHALFRQAMCVSMQNRYDDAGKLYADLVGSYPQSSYVKRSTIFAGRCFYRGDDDGNAQKWLQAAVDAKSEFSPEAAHWLSRLLIAKGESAKVIPLVNGVLPAAGEDQYLANLKMDLADAQYNDPATREASLEGYLKIVADHADSSVAASALYNAAFTSMELGKNQEALDLSNDFLKKHADNGLTPDVKHVLAESQLRLKSYADAEKGFSELIAAHKDHAEFVQWHLRLGLAIYLQKKYAETVAALEGPVATFENAPAKAEGYYLVGISQYQLKENDKAITSLSASLAADAKWRQADETTVYLARAQRATNKLDAAVATLQKALKDFPNSNILDQINFRLGDYLYSQQKYAEAEAAYGEVLKGYPDSVFAPYALYGKGWSVSEQSKTDDAIAAFSEFLTKHKDHALAPDSQYARAMVYKQTKVFDKAKTDLDAYLATNPAAAKKLEALYQRGLVEVGLKDYDAAVATLTEVSKDKDYPRLDRVVYELAWAYRLGSKPDKSIETFTALASEHGDSPMAAEAFFIVAESKYTARDYENAEKDYSEAKKRATKENRLREKIIHKLGWTHYLKKDYANALKEFSEQRSEYPKGALNADASFMEGECQFKMEKYTEAAAAFNAALAGTMSSPKMKALALLHGGQASSRVKDWANAEKLLLQVLKDFPEPSYLPEAHYELGWIKHGTKKTDEALTYYEKAAAASRGGTGARARFMMGEVHFAAKKYAEAITEFKRCMYGYGAKNATADAKNWQAKSAFEAGRCAEVQIQSATGADRAKIIKEATDSYNYVVSWHAEHELVKDAQKRLAALAKLK